MGVRPHTRGGRPRRKAIVSEHTETVPGTVAHPPVGASSAPFLGGIR